jgi:hypothetical protein
VQDKTQERAARESHWARPTTSELTMNRKRSKFSAAAAAVTALLLLSLAALVRFGGDILGGSLAVLSGS